MNVKKMIVSDKALNINNKLVGKFKNKFDTKLESKYRRYSRMLYNYITQCYKHIQLQKIIKEIKV